MSHDVPLIVGCTKVYLFSHWQTSRIIYPEEPEAIGIQCLTHADDGYVVLRYVKGYKAP
jgi:hypothetical protein